MSIDRLAQNPDYKELKSMIQGEIDDITLRILSVSLKTGETLDHYAMRMIEMKARREGLEVSISYVKEERTFDHD